MTNARDSCRILLVAVLAATREVSGWWLSVPLTALAIVARPPLLPTGAVGGTSRMAGPLFCLAGH